jgi:hypothetical protein
MVQSVESGPESPRRPFVFLSVIGYINCPRRTSRPVSAKTKRDTPSGREGFGIREKFHSLGF